ncbi:MAG: tripartite tricarboxylate transporter substrate binding protein [Planctomycetota bacterium]
MPRWSSRNLLAAGILSVFLSSCSCGQDHAEDAFPRKPIKVIVPFGAGGGTDTFTRILQSAIERHDLLPQPLVIINVPGAGGAIGSRRVKNARPDGYTILQIHEGMVTNKHFGKTNFGPESFQPIAGTGKLANLIAVPEDSQFEDLQGLLETAKRKPESIAFAVGIGAPSHFAGLMLEASQSSECRFRFTQSGGGAKRFASLLGGHSDVSTFSVAEFIEFQKSGLRALAILSDERSKQLPEVPTARELGVDVESSNMHFWWAPKGTPIARTERIAEALRAAMAIGEVRKQLQTLATSQVVLTGDKLANNLAEREQRIASVSRRELPRLPNIGIAILGFTLLSGVVAFRPRFAKSATHLHQAPKQEDGSSKPNKIILPVWLCVFTLLYVVSLQYAWLDYRVATAAFIMVSGMTLAPSRKLGLPVLILALMLSLGLHALFTQVLVLDLP